MTTLNPRSISVDYVPLDNHAFFITERTGIDITPGLIGDNLRVPGRDGEVWRSKDYASGRMVLQIAVKGSDADGNIPVGSTSDATFRANMDKLLAIFSQRTRLLQVDKEMEVGSSRRNFAEVGAVIQPQYFDADALATLTVELIFPDPLWFDPIAVSSNGTGGTSSTQRELTLTNFKGITAPVSDASIVITGPATNPLLTDGMSGSSIQYSGTITSGQKWEIDCANFTSTIKTTGGAFVSNGLAVTQFLPGPRFFQITGQPSGDAPVVTMSGTGFTTATTINITASKRYVA